LLYLSLVSALLWQPTAERRVGNREALANPELAHFAAPDELAS
jgi:hypothetical protein